MSLTISWPADTPVVDAPGRPSLFCPESFTATWGDGAHIDIAVTTGAVVTSKWYLPGGLGERTSRDAWRERIAEAMDGACWAIEQLTPKQLSDRVGHKVKVAGKPRRPKLTDEYLEHVAAVHRQAERAGTAKLADEDGLLQPNAAQRVALARRKGILPPASDDERVGASA
jgi:hypothetical protein